MELGLEAGEFQQEIAEGTESGVRNPKKPMGSVSDFNPPAGASLDSQCEQEGRGVFHGRYEIDARDRSPGLWIPERAPVDSK